MLFLIFFFLIFTLQKFDGRFNGHQSSPDLVRDVTLQRFIDDAKNRVLVWRIVEPRELVSKDS